MQQLPRKSQRLTVLGQAGQAAPLKDADRLPCTDHLEHLDALLGEVSGVGVPHVHHLEPSAHGLDGAVNIYNPEDCLESDLIQAEHQPEIRVSQF